MKEQQEPGVCEFGLPLGSQPLQVTDNSPHEEVIKLSLDAKNVRLGAKLCAVIRSVDGSREIMTCVVNTIVADKSSCWGFPLTDLREKQAKDVDLSVILDQLADAAEPGNGVFELFLAGPAVKAYWLNKEQFTLTDEILYQNRDHCDEKDLVVPRALEAEAIWLSLDLSSTSHQGMAQTKVPMKVFYWYGMGVETVAECVASWVS